MDIVKKVKDIDKITSKYFVLFSIIVYGFLFGWYYKGGQSIFFFYHARCINSFYIIESRCYY